MQVQVILEPQETPFNHMYFIHILVIQEPPEVLVEGARLVVVGQHPATPVGILVKMQILPEPGAVEDQVLRMVI